MRFISYLAFFQTSRLFQILVYGNVYRFTVNVFGEHLRVVYGKGPREVEKC